MLNWLLKRIKRKKLREYAVSDVQRGKRWRVDVFNGKGDDAIARRLTEIEARTRQIASLPYSAAHSSELLAMNSEFRQIFEKAEIHGGDASIRAALGMKAASLGTLIWF